MYGRRKGGGGGRGGERERVVELGLNGKFPVFSPSPYYYYQVQTPLGEKVSIYYYYYLKKLFFDVVVVISIGLFVCLFVCLFVLCMESRRRGGEGLGLVVGVRMDYSCT